MKTPLGIKLAFYLFFLFPLAPAFSQQEVKLNEQAKPLNRLAMSGWKLEAITLKSGLVDAKRWDSGYGTYVRDGKKMLTLEVSLSANKPQPPAVLEVFIVGKPAKDNRSAPHRFPLLAEAIPAVNGFKDTFSTYTKHSQGRYVYLQMRDEYGSNIEGWIVRIVQDGTIIALKASTPALEQFANASPEFRSFVLFASRRK